MNFILLQKIFNQNILKNSIPVTGIINDETHVLHSRQGQLLGFHFLMPHCLKMLSDVRLTVLDFQGLTGNG